MYRRNTSELRNARQQVFTFPFSWNKIPNRKCLHKQRRKSINIIKILKGKEKDKKKEKKLEKFET